jgi:hypothetical protein
MQIINCYWKVGEDTGSWPENNVEFQGSQLPSMMRRRLSSLGTMALKYLFQSSTQLKNKEIPWVVACRHGDVSRMDHLLSSLAKKEVVSPTQFSMSVHNAIMGVFSIATKNKKLHTALSGAEVTFVAGLIEAYALQKEKQETVGYLYYHQPLSSTYEDKFEEDPREVCFVLLLANKDQTEPSSQRMQIKYAATGENLIDQDLNEIISFVKFLKSYEKRYEIFIPSGTFLLERTDSKD